MSYKVSSYPNDGVLVMYFKKNCLIFNIKVVEKILIINDKIIFLLSILSFNKCAVHT